MVGCLFIRVYYVLYNMFITYEFNLMVELQVIEYYWY